MNLLTENLPIALPDHTQLPESDGTFVKNFQEHPQSILLTESIEPILQKLHPDAQYCIGQDCGIYWRLNAEPPERGAEAPDWFYVANVPPMLNGEFRRSYVLWQEIISPLIVLEFVSGDGREERDKTPYQGKFWVYERAIKAPYYGIYEVKKASLEMYRLIDGCYQLMSPSDRGYYAIEPLNVAIGIWQGSYKNVELPWLRWWDGEGNLLLSGAERAEIAAQQAEQERQRAQTAAQQAEQERQRAEIATQQAEQERQRAQIAAQQAEQERQRAQTAAQQAEQERQRAQTAEEENARLRERLARLGIDPD